MDKIEIVGNIYPSGHEAGNIYNPDGISTTIKCNGPRANLKNASPKIQVKSATLSGFEEAGEGDSINLSMPNSNTRRGRVGVGVGVAQTLDTQANQSVLLQGNIRRLTEVETERLQGLKDEHTQYGMYPIKKVTQEQMNKMSNEELIALFENTVQKKVPQGQRYKLCGNAVTKDIVELIGKKLLNSINANK